MKYYKVRINSLAPYVMQESDLPVVLEDLRTMEKEEKMTITVLDMSDEDYKNLPEYEGP